MGSNSTQTEFMLSFLNKIFVGVAETVKIRSTATLIVRRADGTEETHASAE